MKILITKDIVNGPNNGKLYRIKAEGEDWITNGDWALKESGCILQQEIEAPIESDATLQTMLEQMSRAEYTDDPDFSVAVHPLYAPIIAQMNDLDNIRVCVATKTLPIIFLDIDKKQPVGFLMPCVSEEDVKELYKAKSKQELMLILNNYKAYVEKHDLIPVEYKINWGKSADGKEDPTKGLVFIKYISDVIKEMNKERLESGKSRKEVKAAVLLPVSVAIGTSNIISDMKSSMLEDNTLEAVFTLPNELFYPGASASACCMVFTLGKPHVNADGFAPKTFFGYFKEDGHKKKKNLGRVEQFDKDNESIWERIEKKWLELYRNKTVEDGLSAMQVVNGNDEWLCEAYMKTDYSKLTEADFQKTINDYLAYLVKNGKVFEDDET